MCTDVWLEVERVVSTVVCGADPLLTMSDLGSFLLSGDSLRFAYLWNSKSLSIGSDEISRCILAFTRGTCRDNRGRLELLNFWCYSGAMCGRVHACLHAL
jgi:hypothetical protein